MLVEWPESFEFVHHLIWGRAYNTIVIVFIHLASFGGVLAVADCFFELLDVGFNFIEVLLKNFFLQLLLLPLIFNPIISLHLSFFRVHLLL